MDAVDTIVKLAREFGPIIGAIFGGGAAAGAVVHRKARRAARANDAPADVERDGSAPCSGCDAIRVELGAFRDEFRTYRDACDRDRKALREDLKHDVAGLREIVAEVEQDVAVALDRTAGDRGVGQRGRG